MGACLAYKKRCKYKNNTDNVQDWPCIIAASMNFSINSLTAPKASDTVYKCLEAQFQSQTQFLSSVCSLEPKNKGKV